MADSTSVLATLLLTTLQSAKEAAANNLFNAGSPADLYANNPATTTGLTWGYIGGRIAGITIANGTVALTLSTTNYVVAARATGVVTASTATTNWNDAANYLRTYSIVTGASTITSYLDFREAIGAITSTFTGGTMLTAINEAPIVTVASATTTNAFAAASNTVSISGTTTITAFDTVASGFRRRVIFEGVLQLTHHATSNILPTGANITTAAGDTAEIVSLGSGNTRMTDYMRKSGAALLGGAAWGGITGTLSSQTDLQAALDLKQARSPAIQSVASAATVTPTFSNDAVWITAQAAGLTLANPTGTAIDGLGMVIRIKDNGTARSITFGSEYRAIGVTLPTTTVISKTLYLAMIFNNIDTKWDVLATGQEA